MEEETTWRQKLEVLKKLPKPPKLPKPESSSAGSSPGCRAVMVRRSSPMYQEGGTIRKLPHLFLKPQPRTSQDGQTLNTKSFSLTRSLPAFSSQLCSLPNSERSTDLNPRVKHIFQCACEYSRKKSLELTTVNSSKSDRCLGARKTIYVRLKRVKRSEDKHASSDEGFPSESRPSTRSDVSTEGSERTTNLIRNLDDSINKVTNRTKNAQPVLTSISTKRYCRIPECLDTSSEFFNPHIPANDRFDKYLAEMERLQKRCDISKINSIVDLRKC